MRIYKDSVLVDDRRRKLSDWDFIFKVIVICSLLFVFSRRLSNYYSNYTEVSFPTTRFWYMIPRRWIVLWEWSKVVPHIFVASNKISKIVKKKQRFRLKRRILNRQPFFSVIKPNLRSRQKNLSLVFNKTPVGGGIMVVSGEPICVTQSTNIIYIGNKHFFRVWLRSIFIVVENSNRFGVRCLTRTHPSYASLTSLSTKVLVIKSFS